MYEAPYVLIVDDDDDARALMTAIVRALGHPTRAAPDSVHAIELMRQQAPAMVILDLMMPGVTGFELLSSIQTNPSTKYTPVLIVTGAPINHLDVPDLYGTVCGVLRKAEFDVVVVEDIIMRILGRSATGE